MLVSCLFDGGSESSYFHPDLERMATSRRRKRFHLETLSMEGKVEEVDGLMVTFEAIMADGQVKKIEALMHNGLGKSGTMLRSKVLSVPIEFANHWNLEKLEVTKTDPSDPSSALYTRQPQRMLLVVGLDLYHYFPPMLDSYKDKHGLVSLHHCPFSGRILACGNRTFPLSPTFVKNILNRLDSSQGFFNTVYEIKESKNQSNDSSSPVQMTLLSAAAIRAPALPTETEVARPAPGNPGDTANLPICQSANLPILAILP